MESYTFGSNEAMEALRAKLDTEDGYTLRLGTSDAHTVEQAFPHIRDAFGGMPILPSLQRVANGEEVILTPVAAKLLTGGLLKAWNEGDDNAGSLLSGIAETLGVEFV